MTVVNGHLIARSDLRHPESGKYLIGISELKPADVPPLFTTESAAAKWVREVDPWNKTRRTDPYGNKWGTRMKANQYKTKERRLAGEEGDAMRNDSYYQT